jgi:hypothetical protein
MSSPIEDVLCHYNMHVSSPQLSGKREDLSPLAQLGYSLSHLLPGNIRMRSREGLPPLWYFPGGIAGICLPLAHRYSFSPAKKWKCTRRRDECFSLERAAYPDGSCSVGMQHSVQGHVLCNQSGKGVLVLPQMKKVKKPAYQSGSCVGQRETAFSVSHRAYKPLILQTMRNDAESVPQLWPKNHQHKYHHHRHQHQYERILNSTLSLFAWPSHLFIHRSLRGGYPLSSGKRKMPHPPFHHLPLTGNRFATERLNCPDKAATPDRE